MPDMRKYYNEQVRPALQEKLGLKNVMEIPKLKKIVISTGIGTKMEKDAFSEARTHLSAIAGQGIAPSKGMDFSRVIQGKPYAEALAIAEISPRKAAKLFAKTLKCAKAAAAESGMNEASLMVKTAVADPGPDAARRATPCCEK